jgi:hypothetical protein
LRGYVDGSKPIPTDGRVVRRLVYQLVWVAGMIDDGVRRKRLRAAAATLDPDAYREEYQLHEQWTAKTDARGVLGRLLSPGLHIAPFLSESGEMVMLPVDARHRLGCMQEFDAIESRRVTAGASTTASSVADFYRAYGHELLTEGVHLARWRPWSGKGVVYLAIDAEHRLVAMVEVPDHENGAALVAAKHDMATALEIVKAQQREQPDTYHESDGYEDTDDDDFNGGDEWKRGSRYDPRVRR